MNIRPNGNATSPQEEQTRSLLILGGGLAGLWAGYRLREHGFQVSILEQGPTPGGLMETATIDGFLFDLGPHILLKDHLFHYRQLVGDAMRPVRGFYGFGFEGKQVLSPIQPMNLLGTIGIPRTLPMLLSMLYAKLVKKAAVEDFTNVEEVIIARFGERICRYFFRDYIPKVTGLPAVEVSPDWFLERYRFYQENKLWANLVGRGFRSMAASWRKKQMAEEALHLFYPALGAQMITDALAGKIQEKGGIIHLGARVEVVERLPHQVAVHYTKAGGERQTETVDVVISTLPVTELVEMLSPPAPADVLEASRQLCFRRLALFFLLLDRERLTEKIQIYFPESRYPFKRIYEPKNLDPTMGTKGKTGICVEVCFGAEDGPFEQIKEGMYRSVLEGLHHFFGLREEEVACHRVREVPYAYAVYRNGYRDQLQTLASHLFSMDNVISYGRQGSFRYNHLVDRVIDAFKDVYQYIETGRSKKEFLGSPSAKSAFF